MKSASNAKREIILQKMQNSINKKKMPEFLISNPSHPSNDSESRHPPSRPTRSRSGLQQLQTDSAAKEYRLLGAPEMQQLQFLSPIRLGIKQLQNHEGMPMSSNTASKSNSPPASKLSLNRQGNLAMELKLPTIVLGKRSQSIQQTMLESEQHIHNIIEKSKFESGRRKVPSELKLTLDSKPINWEDQQESSSHFKVVAKEKQYRSKRESPNMDNKHLSFLDKIKLMSQSPESAKVANQQRERYRERRDLANTHLHTHTDKSRNDLQATSASEQLSFVRTLVDKPINIVISQKSSKKNGASPPGSQIVSIADKHLKGKKSQAASKKRKSYHSTFKEANLREHLQSLSDEPSEDRSRNEAHQTFGGANLQIGSTGIFMNSGGPIEEESPPPETNTQPKSTARNTQAEQISLPSGPLSTTKEDAEISKVLHKIQSIQVINSGEELINETPKKEAPTQMAMRHDKPDLTIDLPQVVEEGAFAPDLDSMKHQTLPQLSPQIGESSRLVSFPHSPQVHRDSNIFLADNTPQNMINTQSRVSFLLNQEEIRQSEGEASPVFNQKQQVTASRLQFTEDGDRAFSRVSNKTVHSLLQKPPNIKINVGQALKEQIDNYTNSQMAYFLEKMNPQKFQKLMYKEVKPNAFLKGQGLRKEWDDRISFKIKNKLYHHLVTFEKWQEMEMMKQREKEELERSKNRKVEPHPHIQRARRGSFSINRAEFGTKAAMQDKVTAALIKQAVVQEKIENGQKLDYQELTHNNCQLKYPQIKPRYLLHKELIKPMKEDKQPVLMRKNLKKARPSKPQAIEPTEDFTTLQTIVQSEKFLETYTSDPEVKGQEATSVYSSFSNYSGDDDDDEDDETIELNLAKYKRYKFSEEVEKMIADNINYDCRPFKKLVRSYLNKLNLQKSEFQRAKDEMIAKHNRERRNAGYFKKFYREIELKGNLLDYDFIKKKYKNLGPKQKIIQKEKDFKKYDQPVTLKKQHVLGLIKLKLKKSMDDALQEFVDDHHGVQRALSPQKQYKVSQYIKDMTQKIKLMMVKEKRHLDTEQDIMEETYSSSVEPTCTAEQTMGDTFMFDLNVVSTEEATRLKQETRKLNANLTGKNPPHVEIFKDEAKKEEFILKIKDRVSKNSLLEAHRVALPEDEDLEEYKNFQHQHNNKTLSLKPQMYLSSPAKAGASSPGDAESLFIKMCEDERFLPVFDILRRLTSKELSKSLFLQQRPLNSTWCSIIKEVLSKEKDFKYMVKKLILHDNYMNDVSFAQILEGLQCQDGLETLTYIKNQIGPLSVRILEDFLSNKNLEQLTISNVLKSQQDTVNLLVTTVGQGRTLTRLTLSGIEYLNTLANFQALDEALFSCGELRHLNLSNNQFNQKQVGRITQILAERMKDTLVTLNLSYNNLRPYRCLVFKNKRDKKGKIGDSPHVELFYKSINEIILNNIIQDLNFERMNLKEKAPLLCDSMVRNTSLLSVHLGYNYIDKQTMAQIKWFLSIGIDVPPKGMPVTVLPFESEPEQEPEEPPEEPVKKKPKKKKKKKPANNSDLEAQLQNIREESSESDPDQIKNPYSLKHHKVPLKKIGQLAELKEIKSEVEQETRTSPPLKHYPSKEFVDDFEVNLANQIDRKEFKEADDELKLIAAEVENDEHKEQKHHGHIVEEGIADEMASFSGGVLILSRMIGHSEFETVHPPMFPKEKIAKVRFELEEAERIKKEIEMYGGVLSKGGVIKSVDERPDSASDTVSKKETTSELDLLLKTMSRRASMFPSEAAQAEFIQNLKMFKYNFKVNNLKWQIRPSCWYCHQSKYAVLFYQRSVSRVWFEHPKDSSLYNIFPKTQLQEWRYHLSQVNTVIDLLKPEEIPLYVNPLVAGSFDISGVKQMVNPMEYVDILIRDQVVSEVSRKLSDKREEIFEHIKKKSKARAEFKKHFMVAYEDNWKEKTSGVSWMKQIQKTLRYENDTVFLNCPPLYDLSVEKMQKVEDSCMNGDLFLASGFLQPGPQKLIVLDCKMNKQTNQLEEVLYSKEVIIDHRKSHSLAKIPGDEYLILNTYLTHTCVQRYDEIKEQLKVEQKKKDDEEKRLRKLEKLLAEQEAAKNK